MSAWRCFTSEKQQLWWSCMQCSVLIMSFRLCHLDQQISVQMSAAGINRVSTPMLAACPHLNILSSPHLVRDVSTIVKYARLHLCELSSSLILDNVKMKSTPGEMTSSVGPEQRSAKKLKACNPMHGVRLLIPADLSFSSYLLRSSVSRWLTAAELPITYSNCPSPESGSHVSFAPCQTTEPLRDGESNTCVWIESLSNSHTHSCMQVSPFVSGSPFRLKVTCTKCELACVHTYTYNLFITGVLRGKDGVICKAKILLTAAETHIQSRHQV